MSPTTPRAVSVVGWILVLSVVVPPAQGTTITLGYDSVWRREQDVWTGALVIPDPSQQLLVGGRVTGWQYYLRAAGAPPFYLGVWRLNITSGLYYYSRLGHTLVTPAATASGRAQLSVPAAQQFSVEAGDVLGIYFPQRNPVPYSVYTSATCRAPRTFLYARNVTAGGVTELPSAGSGGAWHPCRIYSVSAVIDCTASRCYKDYLEDSCVMANPQFRTAQSGRLSSHSAARRAYFISGLDCGLTLTTTAGKSLRLAFDGFRLTGPATDNCDLRVNYLRIYEGTNSSGKLLGTYCGTQAPADVVTCGHQAYVYFYTSTVGDGGFNITYTTEAPATTCIVSQTGTIVGAIVGALLGAAVIAGCVAGVVIFHRHRMRQKWLQEVEDARPQKKESDLPRLLLPPSDYYYYDRPLSYGPTPGGH